MPHMDAKDEITNPSDVIETLDDAGAAPEGADLPADGADSSDAQGEGESSTLSIVRDVVAARDKPAASPAEGQEAGESPDDAGTQSPERDDEDYSDVPFNKHPRFRDLLRKAKSNEADAVRYRNVQTYLDNNGIAPEEAAEGFAIMAAMKTNPVEAWKMLKPHVQTLLQAAGEVLPETLAQRVQTGEISREAAQEIARAEARAQAVETGRTFEQQRAERQRMTEHANSLRGAAEDWEQDRLRKDPNFAAKQESLIKELLYLQQTEGRPNTPEGVRDQLNRAYKAVVPAPIRSVPAAPKVGQQAPVKPSAISGGASSNSRPAPKTTLDIIDEVVARSRR